MHYKIEVIRWLLVMPAAFVGWYVALFMGILLYSVADSFCPPEYMISGVCTATWYKSVIDGLVVFGASLSAILAILFSFLIAPSKKVLVAKVILLGGYWDGIICCHNYISMVCVYRRDNVWINYCSFNTSEG